MRLLLAALCAALSAALPAQDQPPGRDAGQDQERIVADSTADPPLRCAALAALQDRSALTVPVLAAALGGECEPLRDTAVAIVRHEWVEWPKALLAVLSADATAAHAVLGELALAPRPAVDAWVAHMAANSPHAPLRWLALAARQRPPDRAEAEAALRALGEGSSEAALAVARVPSPVADQLVGVLHQMLLPGAFDALGPFLWRLSPAGNRQVLGLAASLDADTGARLCEHLCQRDDAEYWERVRAAVDGEIPLEAIWLRRAGRFLTTAPRRERVAAVLADAEAPPLLRLLAFEALREARAWAPSLAAFAKEGAPARWRRLLSSDVEVPDEIFHEALAGDEALRHEAVRALARRRLSPSVEAHLVELLRAADAGDGATAAWRSALLAALAQGASDTGVAVALVVGRTLPSELPSLYDTLGHRRDPVGSRALVEELQRPPFADGERAAELRDHLGLVLAESGDRRELAALVAAAPRRPASFVRRCRHALPQLPPEHWRSLTAALPATADADVRVELLLWLGGAPLPELRDVLHAAARTGATEEEREVALQGLLQGPERQQLVRRWLDAQCAGAQNPEAKSPEATGGGDGLREGQPLPALRLTGETFELAVVATTPKKLLDDDVAVLRHLLFVAPRRDPREPKRAAQFADGRTGFPVVAAIASHLRVDPGAAAAVCAPAASLAAARDVEGLVRQRFLFLWTALQAEPELRIAVGKATAALVLAIPDAHDAGASAAHYYAALEHSARGDHRAAAAAFRAAAAKLLRLPQDAMHARIHLGVRDTEAGIDPWAALASAGWLADAQAALAAGDAATAATAAARAREFCGRDAATRAAATAILQPR